MAEISAYYKDILNVIEQDLPWKKLSGCNILITGSTGLIGGCLVEALLMNRNRDYQIYASGRSIERLTHRFNRFIGIPGFHFLAYDVECPLDSIITFDYIIHAASYASPFAFVCSPVEVMKSNLYGVCNLLEYGINHGMKRFLFLSSGEVYGQGDGRIFTEEYSGFVNCSSPRSCYPSSKRAAETLCASYREEYGTDVVIARPCHIYGPYFTDSDNRVYAQFINNILNDEDIVMKSNGAQFRSWCYVVDCVCALLYVLLKGTNGESYNVADPLSTVTIKDLASIVSKIGGKKVVFSIPNQNEKKAFNPVSQSVFSIEKIKSLGWSPIYRIEDGLKHTIEERRASQKIK